LSSSRREEDKLGHPERLGGEDKLGPLDKLKGDKLGPLDKLKSDKLGPLDKLKGDKLGPLYHFFDIESPRLVLIEALEERVARPPQLVLRKLRAHPA